MLVYHFFSDPRKGGPHVFVDSIKMYHRDNITTKIVTCGKSSESDLNLFNFRYIWRPLYIIEIFLNVILIIFNHIKAKPSQRPDIYHVHSMLNIAPIIASRFTGIRTVWHIHECLNHYYFFLQVGMYISKKCKIISVSETAIKQFCLSSIELIPAAIDTSFWESKFYINDNINFEYNNDEEEYTLLAVGNINPLKGFDVLLESLETIKSPIKLQIIGEELTTHKAFSEKLKQTSQKMIYDNSNLKVEFLGRKNSFEVRKLLFESDCFVLSSRSEACPIALLEAVSMGVPCIAADVGDTRSILSIHPNAKIFSVGSVQELAQAINLMSINKTNKTCRRSFLQSKFSAHNVASQLEEIYLKLNID